MRPRSRRTDERVRTRFACCAACCAGRSSERWPGRCWSSCSSLLVAGDSGLFSAKGIVNFLEVSAQLGILAAAVALLMIAGEFDLSVGSMIGFAGIVIAIPATHLGLAALARRAAGLRAARSSSASSTAWSVVRTGLPSFIVTLGSLFMLRGLTLGVTRLITGRTQVSGIHELSTSDWLAPLFAGQVGADADRRGWPSIGFIGKRADGLPIDPGHPGLDPVVARR